MPNHPAERNHDPIRNAYRSQHDGADTPPKLPNKDDPQMTDAISPPVLDDPAGLTPAWVSAALASTGVEVEIIDVRPERVGTGQIGTSYRLHLTYADPATAATAGAPASLVAKMAGGDPASRDLISDGYRNEYGFYTEIADTVAITTPRCWYAVISDDNTCFVLLLDDLAPAEPGEQVRGCTLDEARLALINLAGLHGPRWCDDSLRSIPWMNQQTAEGAAFYGDVLAGAVETFNQRFAHLLPAADAELFTTIPAHLGEWMMTRPERFSTIHGDYRPDNLMFLPDGSAVSTVDWQTLGLGLPGRDVGYFLATSIDPALRRTHERELVGTYHEALLAGGVTGHSFEECFEDYRLGTIQAPLITILGAVYASAEPTPQSDAMFMAMATRAADAIRDLDPLSLL